MSKYYIGIMCGTSLDSIDISIASITGKRILVKFFDEYKLDLELKDKINAVKKDSHSPNNLKKVNSSITLLIAKHVQQSISKYKLTYKDIHAVGFTGITLNHRPDLKTSTFIGDPILLSKRLKISVVSDFRQTDIDAGGQGAPLAGLFHNYLNRIIKKNITYLNLGGFANITVSHEDRTISYDTGPANYLIDLWCDKYFDMEYDIDGSLASMGNINIELLKSMLKEKYFKKKYPKSTGFELFNESWVQGHLKKVSKISDLDILATLTYLTVITVSNELKKYKNNKSRLFIYGGGSSNKILMNGILDISGMKQTEDLKNIINEKNLEATAFAWLAYMRQNEIEVTNMNSIKSKKTYLLGNIY